MVLITLQSIGENEYDKTGHLKLITFLRHFMIILKRNLFRASILHHNTETDNTCLNDAFDEQRGNFFFFFFFWGGGGEYCPRGMVVLGREIILGGYFQRGWGGSGNFTGVIFQEDIVLGVFFRGLIV